MYKRQGTTCDAIHVDESDKPRIIAVVTAIAQNQNMTSRNCLLYTSDAADERSSVDLGGRRIIKKKTTQKNRRAYRDNTYNTTK